MNGDEDDVVQCSCLGSLTSNVSTSSSKALNPIVFALNGSVIPNDLVSMSGYCTSHLSFGFFSFDSFDQRIHFFLGLPVGPPVRR